MAIHAGRGLAPSYGPGSAIDGLDDHPVVHVAFDDAEAYAHGPARTLPTEAEWEFAARGGLDGAEFAWGDEFTPGGRHMANTWQGEFPAREPEERRLRAHVAGRRFPANGYGLRDMIGNVWEWTTDWYSQKHQADAAKACCIPQNPRGGPKKRASIPASPQIRIPRKVLEGRLAPVRAELLPSLPPRRRAMRSRSTRRRATSDSGASPA